MAHPSDLPRALTLASVLVLAGCAVPEPPHFGAMSRANFHAQLEQPRDVAKPRTETPRPAVSRDAPRPAPQPASVSRSASTLITSGTRAR